jgi:hypothetical protein
MVGIEKSNKRLAAGGSIHPYVHLIGRSISEVHTHSGGDPVRG